MMFKVLANGKMEASFLQDKVNFKKMEVHGLLLNRLINFGLAKKQNHT